MTTISKSTKKCSKCGKTRVLSKFDKDLRYKLGVSCWCKQCRLEYEQTPKRRGHNRRRWKRYLSNPENREYERQRSLKKYHRNPRKIKDQVMRRRVGVSLRKFERTNRCLLCKRKVRLV